MKTLRQTQAADDYRMAMGLMTMRTTDNTRITETAILEHKHGRTLKTLAQISAFSGDLYAQMHEQDRQWDAEDAEKDLNRIA